MKMILKTLKADVRKLKAKRDDLINSTAHISDLERSRSIWIEVGRLDAELEHLQKQVLEHFDLLEIK